MHIVLSHRLVGAPRCNEDVLTTCCKMTMVEDHEATETAGTNAAQNASKHST